ncbi:MAG TPA: threonine synthase [Woeseiaceae bacterium]
MLSRYADFLPLTSATPMVDLGEGSTPLVKSSRIGPSIGVNELYFKLESCNPTGSFKDRGMVMAVAKALEEGSQAVLCASTGNTSASAAAYAAHSGLDAYVFLPMGRTAAGKLAQSIAYGAQVVAIDGTFDDALRLAREFTAKHPVSLVNSVNMYRIQGQKTAAFEIVDDLGDAPGRLFIPVGNAGNITAYWAGFSEYMDQKLSTRRPRMMGYQAAGAAPIVRDEIVEDPQTIASAIRIGNPASWRLATAARDESEGAIDSVTDEEIIAAYQRMAREEGIFCEPASAAGVAGLIKYAERNDISNETCVCVITGMGLKDPDSAAKSFPFGQIEAPADLAAIEAALPLR